MIIQTINLLEDFNPHFIDLQEASSLSLLKLNLRYYINSVPPTQPTTTSTTTPFEYPHPPPAPPSPRHYKL